MTTPHCKRIPIAAARRIAEEYGYDQVVIYARKVDTPTATGGEHMTTYGTTKAHCTVAGLMAKKLQEFMGWGKSASWAKLRVSPGSSPKA